LPNGREYYGIAAIREMHLEVFAAQAAAPSPIEMVLGTDSAAAEIATQLPDGSTRSTANFFYFDGAGQIRRISVYRQGQ
jgi:hypothetical protein